MKTEAVEWKIGDVARVFDCDAWRIVGHDVGDNSMFWRPATIIEIYKRPDGDVLADVQFHGDGRFSRGHFIKVFLRSQEGRSDAR